MYKVIDAVFPAVVDTQGRVVLEAISDSYAIFLCDLLNAGMTEDDSLKRPAPDLEYYKLTKDGRFKD